VDTFALKATQVGILDLVGGESALFPQILQEAGDEGGEDGVSVAGIGEKVE
jgi:hypothetical protein